MGRKRPYDDKILFKCYHEDKIAFKNKYPNNYSQVLRDFVIEVISENSELDDLEIQEMELKNQLDLINVKLKDIQRKKQKQKELQLNEDLIKQRLDKAIGVCKDKFKASNYIGITMEEIRDVARVQKINKYVLFEAIGCLEDREEIKILTPSEIASEQDKQAKEKRESKYKPEVSSLMKIFDRMDRRYQSNMNNIHDPFDYMEENKEFVETQIEKEGNDITFEEVKDYFINHHSKKKTVFEKW